MVFFLKTIVFCSILDFAAPKKELLMRILLSWLKDFVNPQTTLNNLCDSLTLAGLEVDGLLNASFDFKGVILARVERVESHPSAERLKVAFVTDGTKLHQVVCGAPNCEEGMVVAFAPVGATLTSESGKLLTIEKANLRGIESFGMLCSAKELGLSEENSGLMSFPKESHLGQKLSDYLYDPIIEIGLTPNLGHAASILGIARETAAYFDTAYKIPPREMKSEKPLQFKASITIEDKEDCYQYHLRKIEGVTVGPSPKWLQDRLLKSGHSVINNIVDAINYTMMEMGQPMHAFDADLLKSSKIVIRKAGLGEKIFLLNGNMHEIHEGSLTIFDDEVPIALAGVMGGKESAIHEGTKNIVIESAEFSPREVRKSVKKNQVRSDSSFRFERGIDPEATVVALNRAVALILEIAGGTASKEIISSFAKKRVKPPIALRLDEVDRILGISLSQNEIRTLLERLEFDVKIGAKKQFSVVAPSYRNDIKEEIDVIEEILRLYGFNNIPRTRASFSTSTTSHSQVYLLDKEVRSKLIESGLQEFLTCNLISPQLANIGEKENLISVLHAKSIDQSILRGSFLPTFLAAIKHNHNRQNFDIQAFEIGSLHLKEEERYCEKRAAAIAMTGKLTSYHFEEKPRSVDFFDLKGVIENLFASLGAPSIQFKKSSFKTMHPGRQAEIWIKGEMLGVMGEVHPTELHKIDIDPKHRIYFAQIDLEKVLALGLEPSNFTKIPEYPSSQRDLTITLSDKVHFESILKKIDSLNCPSLVGIELLDIFKDEQKVGIGKQNVSLRFTYREDHKTIETKDVEEAHSQIQKKIEELIY
jgi:phenylalanyl-tRNA synthetase beta chain